MFKITQHTFNFEYIQFNQSRFKDLHNSIREIVIHQAFDLYLDRMEYLRRRAIALYPESKFNPAKYEILPVLPGLYLEVESVEGSLKKKIRVVGTSLAFVTGAAWAGVTTFPAFKTGIEEMCKTNDLFGSCILRDFIEKETLNDHYLKSHRQSQPETRLILKINRDISRLDDTDKLNNKTQIENVQLKIIRELKILRQKLPLNSDFILAINSMLAERQSQKISKLKSMIEEEPLLSDSLEKDILPTAFSSLNGYDEHLLTDHIEVDGYDCRVIANFTNGQMSMRSLITMPLKNFQTNRENEND